MGIRVAALVLLAALLPGCFLLGGPCTEFGPRAEAALEGSPDRAALRDGLTAEGWTLREDDSEFFVVATLDRGGHTYVAHAGPYERTPSGRVHLQIRGGPSEADTTEEARAHLEPIVESIFARFDAKPSYSGGNRHCGDI